MEVKPITRNKTSLRRRAVPIRRRASPGHHRERDDIHSILHGAGAQAKLSIGQPNDKYEQEADAVADKVMGMRDADVAQRVESGAVQPLRIQRMCPECEDEEKAQRQPAGKEDEEEIQAKFADGYVQRQPMEEEEELQAKEMPGRTPQVSSGIESRINSLKDGGRPLSPATRSFFEPRFGHDFSHVRVHADSSASDTAKSINARAFTQGNNMVFASGEYQPGSGDGRRLLGHELTHVVQQGSAQKHGSSAGAPVVQNKVHRLVQASFFGDLWEGVKSVGRGIGHAVSSAARWVGGRVRDAVMWGVNLIRDLPARLMRLGRTIIDGLAGVARFIPEAIQALARGGIRGFGYWLWEKAKRGGAWILTLVSRVFDMLGGPELFEFILHMLTRASPLSGAERSAGESVLGAHAIRWNDVRISEGGILGIIFSLNGGRAFTTFHTINLPSSGAHGRSNLAIVVHELTHVYQYERVGSQYLGQAIHAQATIGYGYGGAAGLRADRLAGKHYRDYNREQQAQIAQDYYVLLHRGGATMEYNPFIAELRAGDL